MNRRELLALPLLAVLPAETIVAAVDVQRSRYVVTISGGLLNSAEFKAELGRRYAEILKEELSIDRAARAPGDYNDSSPQEITHGRQPRQDHPSTAGP